MEKIFIVKNDDLSEVNDLLKNGAHVKMIHAVPKPISAYGYAGGDSIEEGILAFGTKLKGFDREDALLSGVESRTSSPVRIVRNEEFQANIHGIYPCGEGAGYAGGITSAAMDGVKIAEAISKKYRNF